MSGEGRQTLFQTPAETRPNADEAAASFRVLPLYGRHVFLRPVSPEDYRFLRAADLGGDLSVRWRFRGATPSPEQWAQSLWNAVLAQHLVIGGNDPMPLGLVVAYQANFQDGYAYLAAQRFGARKPNPLMMFGVALFVDYVFNCWNLHKLYVEIAEYNLAQVQSAIGRFFRLEGQLQDHLWYGGRRWDQLILALYRETWASESQRMLTVARPQPEERMILRIPNPVAGRDGG